MKYIVLIFFLISNIFGATLLSLDAIEESDKVEITLNFDSMFDGSIEQSMSAKGPMLLINGASIEAKKEILFKSGSIKKAILTKESPSKVSLLIESDAPLNIQALKNGDGQKLQIVAALIQDQPAKTVAEQPRAQPNQKASEDFSKSFSQAFDQKRDVSSADSDMYWRYVVVICFMALLLIALIFIKKSYAKKAAQQAMSAPNVRQQQQQYAPPVDYNSFGGMLNNGYEHGLDDGLNIVSQKSIDHQNKLVVLEYGGEKYLLLVGPNSTIVEKTSNARQARDFEEMFLSGDKRLEMYLRSKPVTRLDLYKAQAEGG